MMLFFYDFSKLHFEYLQLFSLNNISKKHSQKQILFLGIMPWSQVE